MVSTRRSRSQQEGCSDDAPGGGLGSPDASQGEVASRRRGGAALEPIAEEAQRGAATAAAAVAAAAAAAGAGGAGAEQQQQGSQQRARRPQQQQQEQEGPAASSSEDGSDSESEDLSDLAFDGPDVLQSLAAAIQSGFNSTPGAQHQQHLHQQQQPQTPQEPDPAQLRWRPHTGLHVPAKAAAAAALTAATAPGRRRKQQQQGQEQQDPEQQQLGGPLVAGDAAPSGPEAAAAAGGAKDPALCKALVAPTLDAAAREREARKSAPDTAGKAWFGLPAPKITEDIKRDLRLLRLRGAYDPKRFYKGFDDTKFPKFFAVHVRGCGRG
jgi:hypothetical protein